MKLGRLYVGVFAFLLTCFLSAGAVSKTYAALLYLEPDKKAVKTGDTFEVTLKLDTEAESPLAVDAVILFNSANLELTEVKSAPTEERFFPAEPFKRITDNKVYIGAAISPGEKPKSGKGSIAVLVFKGVSQGHNVVSFVCVDGKTTDTNITIKKDAVTDILKCSTLKEATYDVSVDGQSTPIPGTPTPTGSGGTPASTSGTPTPSINLSGTPTPSMSPTPTGQLTPSISVTVTPTITGILSTVPSKTPTPSGLPNTGVVETTTMAIGIGIVLTLISLGIKLVL